jgi:hypothetical protein
MKSTLKTIPTFIALSVLGLLSTVNSRLSRCPAQGAPFTYQGRLIDNGARANGSYDLRFAIYDAPSAGTQIGAALTNSAVAVTNGLFTTQLDFGADVFTNSLRN